MDTLKRDYRNIPATPESVWSNPAHFIAFGFGVGAIPFAPGTWGTLFAIPFYLFLQPLSFSLYLTCIIIAMILSMWLCDRVSKDIKVDDHQGMCLDEIIGFLFAMLAVPAGFGWLLAGFILFRFFDILKPWPIRWFDQHVHGGIGAILDDVLAGLATSAILNIIAHFFH